MNQNVLAERIADFVETYAGINPNYNPEHDDFD